ncbi:hypothetical protein BDZ94DRAFT_412765 [Collybia nuda]|uniref:Uncharacterized protein n=1 Tax=Collybia nuda TaxID=64659 RepID=A0A9P6CKA8_9AGAR|nr:hypothetical protein BDZ94DRAFT_412765 [Collybia nuda]
MGRCYRETTQIIQPARIPTRYKKRMQFLLRKYSTFRVIGRHQGSKVWFSHQKTGPCSPHPYPSGILNTIYISSIQDESQVIRLSASRNSTVTVSSTLLSPVPVISRTRTLPRLTEPSGHVLSTRSSSLYMSLALSPRGTQNIPWYLIAYPVSECILLAWGINETPRFIAAD